jgi:uncharacterized membrane protein YfcA
MDAMATLSLAAATIVAGAISGVLAGLFGIGGGTVIVPALYQALTVLGVDEAVRMHISVGTSVGVIVPTSIRSFLAHRKRGAVDMALLRSWLVPLPIGAALAAIVAAAISGEALRLIFATLAVVFGLRLIFATSTWQVANELPGEPVRGIVGVVIGFLSTLMGIGGGILNNTFMTMHGRTMHQAVATSSGVGVLVSIPGIIGYVWAGWGLASLPPFSAGFVNLLALALLIPVSVLTAPIGVHLAHRLSRRQLEIGFGGFLLVVAARFIVSLAGGP